MKIPSIILPVLVVAALFSGYLFRTTFTQPTTNISLGGNGRKTVTCTVDGLKCKGTATFFTRLYSETPGIASIETFATEHRAVFSYDPAVITPNSIRRIMEAPIPLRDGTSRQIFVCQSMN
jgi:hypothetical protein